MTKVCLIAGGARGIGRETARLAAAAGWDVAINFRERSDAAEAAVGDVAALGRKAVAVRGDIARENDILAMFKAAERALGPITGLVNSAGVSSNARVEALMAHELERMFAVNVIGLVLCCREAVRRMSTRRGGKGGAIVNVSSMAATIGGRPGASAYAASKGAVDVFTMGLAREVAAEGIRANAVRPGVTDTDMIGPMRSGRVRAEIEATIPMQRYGNPDEVAQAIVWLLSDQASYVTGAHVNVGGGGFHVGAPAG
jgi:NAD(P)-dependent dehydrogenase (short-subunit alcohol dehydrogenase family)